MRKRIVALVLCLALVVITVGTLSASPVKQGKFSFAQLLQKPWSLIVSLFPSLASQPQEQGQPVSGDQGLKIVKPTEQGLPVIRLGRED